MRVLAVGNMYPPHHLGGYELMWQGAMAHLRSRGNAVRILASDYRSPGATYEPDEPDVRRELRWYWLDHRFPRISWGRRIELERHNLRVLADQLADFRPDVVNWWAMGGMSMSLVEEVRRRGLPAVGAVVDDWLVYGPRVDAWQRACGRLGPLRALVERGTGIPATLDLAGAARWVFVSETVRRHAREAGIDPGGWPLAPGGVDSEAFRPAEPREWGWRLLYVGRIDARKGIATAVRSLSALEQGELLVVGGGDPEHQRELEALANALGLSDRVSFETRPRSELPRLYADADAVIFPVLWEEPWGLVPLEAMAVGRPVVATGTGGSGEYLRDGENCLLFHPRDDPAALAAAVRRLAGDAALRGRLRDGGFETARKHTQAAFNEGIAAALEAAVSAR